MAAVAQVYTQQSTWSTQSTQVATVAVTDNDGLRLVARNIDDLDRVSLSCIAHTDVIYVYHHIRVVVTYTAFEQYFLSLNRNCADDWFGMRNHFFRFIIFFLPPLFNFCTIIGILYDRFLVFVAFNWVGTHSPLKAHVLYFILLFHWFACTPRHITLAPNLCTSVFDRIRSLLIWMGLSRSRNIYYTVLEWTQRFKKASGGVRNSILCSQN